MSEWVWAFFWGGVVWIALAPPAAFVLTRFRSAPPMCEEGSQMAREEETGAAVAAFLWPALLVCVLALALATMLIAPAKVAARMGARLRRGTPS